MLGHKLCQFLPAQGYDVIATLRQPADRYARFGDIFGRSRLVEGIDALQEDNLRSLIAREKPFAVVNCIGLIKQRETANNRGLAIALNAYLPHQLDVYCADAGARLVHFSTDCVFSGRKGKYCEDDISDAEDIYGRTKFLGETEDPAGASTTLRTSIIGREIGPAKYGLFEWFLGQRGKCISGFTGAIYTGFPTIEMTRIVAAVLAREEPLRGVYQVASAPISKFDLLMLLREIGGYPIDITRNDEFKCDRSLVMERFANDTGYAAPSWKNMAEQMIADPTPYDGYERQGHA